jgi:predicted metal-dependent enzyme (double-stranded beta helix superfamily)
MEIVLENQHRLIKKYRELSQAEIDLMNESEELEQIVLDFINRVKKVNADQVVEIDMRWLSIGLTNIEQGFMAVSRSIAKPGNAE